MIAALLSLAIFGFDLLTRKETAEWSLYVIPILIAAPVVSHNALFLFPSADTILIVLGFFLSPEGGSPAVQIANRAMGIFVLWTVSTMVARRKQAEEALARSHQELERRVEERTRELKRTLDELGRSNAELGQFAYVVSHDLQEPLRTVSGFLTLLAKKYQGRLDEKADRYIAFAVDGTGRMSALISDLLAYARVGTQAAEPSPVGMSGLLKQVLANLAGVIRESHAEITSGQLPVVQGNGTQLVQLLQNLIANGIKFRKKEQPPRIHVSAEDQGEEWVFRVQDNGIGIEAGHYEKIFAMFQRLHSREEYPGTGVGLAVCKRIVERHGGRIWVESTPGEGSTFYFTLPAKT